MHLYFLEAILSRYSVAKCTHKEQEAGLSHVSETQLKKPTVWGLLCDLGQIT